MQYYNLSSVGWFLDSNGNLTARDTVGNILAKFIGGAFSGKLNQAAVQTNGLIGSTTATVATSTGRGLVITPQVSGSVVVFASAHLENSTASNGAVLGIFRRTGSTVPAGGTDVHTDTFITSLNMLNNANTAGMGVVVSLTALDTGLTIGTSYVYTITIQATAGGGTVTQAGPLGSGWET